MKKTISLSLLLLLCFSLLTGCGLFKGGEEKVLSDVKPYRIMNKYDRSMMTATRVEVAVYINDREATTDTLRKYTDEIVKGYKDEYKGVMVSFYDIMEETSEYASIPMAVGIWAPKGDFNEALVYHKYKDSNYSTVIKKNKEVYVPTQEEKDQYAKYVGMKDTSIEERFKAMNITEDKQSEFLETMNKVQHRYEEVVQR